MELKCLDVFPPLLKKIVFFSYINMETLPFPLPSALEQPRSLGRPGAQALIHSDGSGQPPGCTGDVMGEE